MAKVISTTVRKRRMVIQQSGDQSEVGENQQRVDVRERARKAASEASAAVVGSAETGRRAQDAVTAAVLGQAIEAGRRAAESGVSTVAATAEESNRRATDSEAVLAGVSESNRKSSQSTGAAAAVADTGRRASDASAAVAAVADAGRRASDTGAMVAASAEIGRRATDATAAIVIPTADSGRRATETLSLPLTAIAMEVGRRATDSGASVIAAGDQGRRATGSEYVGITYKGYANAAPSNTGWTNTANAVGNNETDYASLTATSSGLLGTTSNTTNGTLVLGFADPVTQDIPLSGATITLSILAGANTSGVLPLGQAWNIQLQYSINGSTWTTVGTITGTTNQNGQVYSADITSVIAASYTNLNALQVRATGSVTSGTGVSAVAESRFFSANVAFGINKTY